MALQRYRYLHFDVFTDTRFGGNQLAVFLDAAGLSSATMQAMAREMNFAESTFVMPAESAGSDVRMRIFTPASGDADGRAPGDRQHVRARAGRPHPAGRPGMDVRAEHRSAAG